MTAYHDRLNAGDYLPAPSEADLEEATVADLRAQLEARGLPISGNKQELIDRLANQDADSDE